MTKFVTAIAVLALGGLVAYQRILNTVDTITLAEKKYSWTESPLSVAANDYFWEQFHSGNYDSIPAVLDRLTTAYLDNPTDIRTVNHLAFTHMWALSERQNNVHGPRVIEHATLAQKYFGESYLMNPADTRILSFLSSAKLVNGAICQDKELLKDGYLNGQRAIIEWENFSSFSLAYTLSRLPPADEKFKEGLKLMRTLAERHAKNFDPNSPATWQQIADIGLLDYSDKGKDRVFHNSWIAPHNIEGFFLAYGDMLVKSGNWQEALSVYNLCRYSQRYPYWDYKDVVDRRIANARRNVDVFDKANVRKELSGFDDAILVETGIACRSCHQMSKADRTGDFLEYDAKKLLNRAFYFLE